MKTEEQQKRYDTLYRPKKHLGAGTFGRVEKSLSKIDGKTYAVKLMQNISPIFEQSIRSEAEAMKRAKSDYTVQLLDYFYDSDAQACIFVMPYYRKGNLSKILNQDWSRLDILCFMFQICQAFLSFNKHGACWHLDLKPDNILVKANGEYSICDFGCAKLVDNINNSKMLMLSANKGAGTTLYAAPQVILNNSGSRFSDVWSLGIMLYMILYRKHPLVNAIPNKHHAEIIYAFKEGQVTIDYPPKSGYEEIVEICKAILQPVRRLEWEELKRIIYQCIGLPAEADVVSNIQRFISYAQNVAKIALGLVYYLKKNQKCVEKFEIQKEAEKITASAKAYVSMLYRQVQNTIDNKDHDKSCLKDKMSFYIFPQVQENYSIQQKQRLSHLRSVAEAFCWKEYNQSLNMKFLDVKTRFEEDTKEFLDIFRKKNLDKITITPVYEWEKIEKICSFIIKTNHDKYTGLQYADRQVIEQFGHEIVYQ